jgi:hypothetical protein
MSSGAVALCKHFERGGASSEHGRPHPFWTLPKGSNEEKTAVAEGILERMLREAIWKNVMMLHRGVAVYEIRNGGGYGMRWTLELQKQESSDGEDSQSTVVDREVESREEDAEGWTIKKTTFRGFLEPIIEQS